VDEKSLYIDRIHQKIYTGNYDFSAVDAREKASINECSKHDLQDENQSTENLEQENIVDDSNRMETFQPQTEEEIMIMPGIDELDLQEERHKFSKK